MGDICLTFKGQQGTLPGDGGGWQGPWEQGAVRDVGGGGAPAHPEG